MDHGEFREVPRYIQEKLVQEIKGVIGDDKKEEEIREEDF
jgi:hypothetical protein